MNSLQIGRSHYQVADCWNELRPDQLLPILARLTAPAAHEQLRRLQLLALLTGCPERRLARLSPVALVQLLPLTDFLTGANQAAEQVPLTQQVLPVLRLPLRHDLRRRRWLGPATSLSNLTFGEFIFADTFFVHHARTGQASVLHRLLTVLYRPRRAGAPGPQDEGYAGDERQAFNEYRLAHHARQLAYLPAITQLAVLAWYRGCRQQLIDEFPDVFMDPSQATKGARPADWDQVLRRLSGGAFGPLEQTARQPVRTILAEIRDRIREAEEAKTAARSTP